MKTNKFILSIIAMLSLSSCFDEHNVDHLCSYTGQVTNIDVSKERNKDGFQEIVLTLHHPDDCEEYCPLTFSCEEMTRNEQGTLKWVNLDARRNSERKVKKLNEKGEIVVALNLPNRPVKILAIKWRSSVEGLSSEGGIIFEFNQETGEIGVINYMSDEILEVK